MTLRDFIKLNYGGSQSAFARAEGVQPSQVNSWIKHGYAVYEGMLYSRRRKLIRPGVSVAPERIPDAQARYQYRGFTLAPVPLKYDAHTTHLKLRANNEGLAELALSLTCEVYALGLGGYIPSVLLEAANRAFRAIDEFYLYNKPARALEIRINRAAGEEASRLIAIEKRTLRSSNLPGGVR